MSFLDKQLFLGFVIDEKFQQELDKINPDLIKYFINNDSDYLHYIDQPM